MPDITYKGIYVKKLVSKKESNYYSAHPSYVFLERTKEGDVYGFTYVQNDKPIPHHLSLCTPGEWNKVHKVLGV